MKKLFLLVALAAIFNLNAADAQTGDAALSKSKLGLGVDFAFPMGKFGDLLDYGVGGTLLYQHPVTKNLSITGNVGYLKFTGKEVLKGIRYKEGFVPIKAGARYFFAENFYGTAEAGITISTADGNGTGTSFVYVPGLGLEFPVSDNGSVDLGVRYESWYRSNGTRSFIGIRVGYNF